MRCRTVLPGDRVANAHSCAFAFDKMSRTVSAAKGRLQSLAVQAWRGLSRYARKSSIALTKSPSRIAIKCPAPDKKKTYWGDYHFAKALAKALTRLGYQVRVDLLPDWNRPRSRADDAVVVLRGLSGYSPSADNINICWLISHPELATDAELAQYDHVFIASKTYAETVAARLSKPVSMLLQCSDPEIFRPPAMVRADEVDILFVGNSRGRPRKVVMDAIAERLPLVVYGDKWDGLIDLSFVRGTHIKNSELHAYYGSAKIVLNDHWPDMKDNGFLSNRIFDIGPLRGLRRFRRVCRRRAICRLHRHLRDALGTARSCRTMACAR